MAKGKLSIKCGMCIKTYYIFIFICRQIQLEDGFGVIRFKKNTICLAIKQGRNMDHQLDKYSLTTNLFKEFVLQTTVFNTTQSKIPAQIIHVLNLPTLMVWWQSVFMYSTCTCIQIVMFEMKTAQSLSAFAYSNIDIS